MDIGQGDKPSRYEVFMQDALKANGGYIGIVSYPNFHNLGLFPTFAPDTWNIIWRSEDIIQLVTPESQEATTRQITFSALLQLICDVHHPYMQGYNDGLTSGGAGALIVSKDTILLYTELFEDQIIAIQDKGYLIVNFVQNQPINPGIHYTSATQLIFSIADTTIREWLLSALNAKERELKKYRDLRFLNQMNEDVERGLLLQDEIKRYLDWFTSDSTELVLHLNPNEYLSLAVSIRDFPDLGHAIVITTKMQQCPPSNAIMRSA